MKSIEARVLDATHLELQQPLPEAAGRQVEILVSEPVAPRAVSISEAEPESDLRTRLGRQLREREDAWCRSHPEVLRRFAGEWVVVEGESVVAHGKEPRRVVAQARAQGIRIPYVFFVEEPRPDVVKLGL